jgi:hypothetical protein
MAARVKWLWRDAPYLQLLLAMLLGFLALGEVGIQLIVSASEGGSDRTSHLLEGVAVCLCEIGTVVFVIFRVRAKRRVDLGYFAKH